MLLLQKWERSIIAPYGKSCMRVVREVFENSGECDILKFRQRPIRLGRRWLASDLVQTGP